MIALNPSISTTHGTLAPAELTKHLTLLMVPEFVTQTFDISGDTANEVG